MSLTFIVDDTQRPARFGASAVCWSSAHHLPLWSLRPAFDGDYPDSHQHVVSAGYCVTTGLYRDSHAQEVTHVVQLPESDAVVVLAARDQAHIERLPGVRLFSRDAGDRLVLSDEHGQQLLQLQPDAFGRWTTAPSSLPAPRLCIGLPGRETDLRESPTLAALGDAAHQLNIGITLRFLPPDGLSDDVDELSGLDALILPGGSSMRVVRGQIRLAAATLHRPLPVLGLCLGMQSMATAALQTQAGYADAMLAEVSPAAALHSFIAFDDRRHRCGLLPFSPCAPLPSGPGVMAYNHRYRFNPALRSPLAASGVTVSAETDGIVEAISLPEHPFWHGVQGHPELLSRPDAPHPLFIALLNAAVSAQA
ncbi:gamma-glutamyl-gamma-aminobutyrate hydrolase family protein [Erwinia sp. 9145]|uniref:glutamine amidotransferase-related protein n=1 Tax=Erwinia sp. 9145 TaxID=1500895 RepID=UPI000555AE19|nr:gamma-glutamyl-gamma-aminobutyrate hydrolase family protein [Erwinia sp. 9145]